MARYRTFSEIVDSIRNRLKLSQPNLTTEAGSVARDLFIDPQADQLERVHKSISLVQAKQSMATAVGSDIDKYAKNFRIFRKSGSASSGIAIFTTNDLSSDYSISNNSIVTAKNGTTYKSIGNYVMSSAEKNKYAAVAYRLRNALNVAGITDAYAIEIPVRATRSGKSGNIASLQLISHNLDDGLKVTNLESFSDGTNSESDSTFKSRFFSSFSGANTGTSAGYESAVRSVDNVIDATVITQGDTLMLRDGTETIEINDGSFRILNSGTGGKVDIYVLGTLLKEISESFVFTNLSRTGDITDERNDLIPGQIDAYENLTSDERRVQAFKTGNIPYQPVDSIVSVSGSQSGILAEKSTDQNGVVSGNYELVLDENIETGGSPFGFDRVHFISNSKRVPAESIIKTLGNSVDSLTFDDLQDINEVYQDVPVTGENSKVSLADKSIIQLIHSPITNVSRVFNQTTGELYSIASSNIDSVTGINEDGEIKISGKTLPSSADVLSVDYTWRHKFDGFINYNGADNISMFSDASIADSVDWGVANGIFEEESVIGRTTDDLEYQVETDYNISRVISVYSKTETTATVSTLSTSSIGIELAATDDVISNIISIKNSDSVELYNTEGADGAFSSRTITLPTDSIAEVGDAVSVEYNKVEIFDIDNTDGSSGNNVITLPSEDILAGNDLSDTVESLYLSLSSVYVKYVADLTQVVPSLSFTSLPITGSSTNNTFLNSSLSTISNSYQPVFFGFDDSGNAITVDRFGPTRITAEVTGSVRAGKIKVVGTTMRRVVLDVTEGVVANGLSFDLEADLKEYLDLTTLPSGMSIGRIDSVYTLDSTEEEDEKYDLVGYKVSDNTFDIRSAASDATLDGFEFVLPSTPINNGISVSSGTRLRITILLRLDSDSEELYFGEDGRKITDKMFARIDRLSVSSGFRNSTGTLVGTVKFFPTVQPENGFSYFVDYNFKAPKEGERITLKYNTNTVIQDSTRGIESVRPTTADVLVKEGFDINVDVIGQILVNDDFIGQTDTIIENVANAVANLLNTGTLGGTVDYSDVMLVAASVAGVDSVNISSFNESGNPGKKAFINALSNQTISAGTVLFTAVDRQDFRLT